MGLFSRRTNQCVICGADVGRSAMDAMGHWSEHVTEIEEGEGAGGFTWTCACGPSGMWWSEDYQAAAGLTMHMIEQHGCEP